MRAHLNNIDFNIPPAVKQTLSNSISSHLNTIKALLAAVVTKHVVAPTVQGPKGRPSKMVDVDILQHYVTEMCYSDQVTADLMGVSRRTIIRRKQAHNLNHQWSAVSDPDLVSIVRDVKSTGAVYCGATLLAGHLHSMGLKVQRERVRKALREVDPYGVSIRWAEGTSRRVYHVSRPNALWHIDGWHKLKDYK